MRPLIIATGLCLAATAVSAGTQNDVVTRSGNNLALANGCVYAPSVQGDSWTLLYRQSGAVSNCALTLRTQGKAPKTAVSRVKLGSSYAVGVFR